MKYLLENLGVNLVALACVGVAGFLAVHEKSGWGWFLGSAMLCAALGAVTFQNDKTRDGTSDKG